MVTQVSVKRNKFGVNPPSMTSLPTFTPNDEYITLLTLLHKENQRSKEFKDNSKIKSLRSQLIKIELTMTSEQIICNTKLAIKEQPSTITKSKYKL